MRESLDDQVVWAVQKFGGTSLANAECFQRVFQIVTQSPTRPQAIVVSAMAGVTDLLITAAEAAKVRDELYRDRLEQIKVKYFEAIHTLLPRAIQKDLIKKIESDLKDIEDVLRSIWLGKSISPENLDLVSGYGELWSANLLAEFLKSKKCSAEWLNARDILIVEHGETGPMVDWTTSKKRLDQKLAENPTEIVVITGFVASTAEGVPTTLKRNGSDYTASIFGNLLDAKSITIWTDVDGVLSADPRRVPEAVLLNQVTYSEAIEMAYFGAKVLHPHTMAPLIQKNIPIFIKNTQHPDHPGTVIHSQFDKNSESSPVKGFSTVDQVALINLEGTGMLGVPGVAFRLFGSLREVGVSVILISQASSEHSICFAVPGQQSALAQKTVENAFFHEMKNDQIQKVEVISDCSILAAVGDDMVEKKGVAAKFFSSLSQAGVNIRAVAQGSSERNISAVVDQADSTKALRVVHSGFYLSDQAISVGLIGPGLIGGTFLNQLDTQMKKLRTEFNTDVRVRGILSSKKMALSDSGLALMNWKKDFEKSDSGSDIQEFVDHVDADYFPHSVVIDCTSSEEIAAQYPTWLERGIHVITPNKKGNSESLDLYRNIKSACIRSNTHYLYEATVGAGLPVITTLRDLIQTGDRILQIEGVLSGTLSYLFNSFQEGKKFSEIVLDAKRQGFTEPDPRDDLSGMDVARKVITLAREMGLQLEIEDIALESLVPESLTQVSSEEFLKNLSQLDEVMSKKLTEAKQSNTVLRYVGVIRPDGKSGVELKNYPMDHPFARIQGSDNIIAFRTSRYSSQPLIVQGPGAGPDVTAGGVFGDLLRLASYLGAPI